MVEEHENNMLSYYDYHDQLKVRFCANLVKKNHSLAVQIVCCACLCTVNYLMWGELKKLPME